MAADWRHLAETASLRLVPPPPGGPAIAEAERVLGVRLSESLRDLYAHGDGLVDEWGYGYVLSLAQLTQQNQLFRSSFGGFYMSFDGLVLFGQLGNGDMLFQPQVPPGNDNVFLWDHEDDSRTWYAADVSRAVTRLAGG